MCSVHGLERIRQLLAKRSEDSKALSSLVDTGERFRQSNRNAAPRISKETFDV